MRKRKRKPFKQINKTISRQLRQQFYYTVPEAGRKIGLARTPSYRAAERGQIPTKRIGKLLLVPRERWDRALRQIEA